MAYLNKKGSVGPMDALVGKNLRFARTQAGLSMMEVGRRLERSHQLVAKREDGTVRIAVADFFAQCSAIGIDPVVIVQRVQAAP